jgi:uncharacterized protein (TIGR02596 family)
MTTSSSQNRAFSLLELIAVIFIIGIVAVFVTPAASTIFKGSQLSQAEQILTDQIKLARQLALTKNRSVQVRFIRYGDAEVPGETKTDKANGNYRAIQIFEILESGAAVPLDKPQLFPQAIIISPGTYPAPTGPIASTSSLSTLITDADQQPPKDANSTIDPPLPRGVNYDYQYISFRFLPDGSTNLSSTSGTIWHVTIHNINDRATVKAGGGVVNQTGQSVNFRTLQIDPVSGAVKVYRPSV